MSGTNIYQVIRLSNHPDHVEILPALLENPESLPIWIGIGKIPILTSLIFHMNSCDTYTRTEYTEAETGTQHRCSRRQT